VRVASPTARAKHMRYLRIVHPFFGLDEGGSHLLQRLVLDLLDTLTGYVEEAAHLIERLGVAARESVAERDDFVGTGVDEPQGVGEFVLDVDVITTVEVLGDMGSEFKPTPLHAPSLDRPLEAVERASLCFGLERLRHTLSVFDTPTLEVDVVWDVQFALVVDGFPQPVTDDLSGVGGEGLAFLFLVAVPGSLEGHVSDDDEIIEVQTFEFVDPMEPVTYIEHESDVFALRVLLQVQEALVDVHWRESFPAGLLSPNSLFGEFVTSVVQFIVGVTLHLLE
jgi:hypothetical protein